MKTLPQVIEDAENLTQKEQAQLASHLLANLDGAPLGPDDEEIARREAEIESGTAELITFEQLRSSLGR